MHASQVAHTPPARITHEYSYTRPGTTLTPRFDYKLNPYTYKLANEVDEEIEAEKLRRPVRRSASVGLASTLVRVMSLSGERQNCYPVADYKKDTVSCNS